MFVNIRKECYYPPTTLPKDIAPAYQDEYSSPIVAVKLDNTLHDLQTAIRKTRNLEFVELGSEEGWIVYRRSVEFLMIAALRALYDNAEVEVKFRANNGLYCEIAIPGVELTDEVVGAVEVKMKEFVREKRPIQKEVLPREEAVALFKQSKQIEKANLIASLDMDVVSIYRSGDYYDYLYGAMVDNAGKLDRFALDRFEAGVLLRSPGYETGGKVPSAIAQPKLSGVLAESKHWAHILRCRYVTDLNRRIRTGTLDEVVAVSEALQEKRIAEIADHIAADRDIRFVLIAGPSSSGKTSFAQRLRIQMKAAGLRPISISLDNYFCDREDTPLTPTGEYDYENLEALDIASFNRDMVDLMQGKEVQLPTYDFVEGRRKWDGLPLAITDTQPIIIEGIHGLNERLTQDIPRKNKFKVYISSLTQLNIDGHNRVYTTDARLLRRLVRDYKYRASTALKTLKQWPDVRAGEEKYIFPYQEEADVMFNSALIYELAALRRYAVPLLEAVPADVPEYTKARRLLGFCQYFLDLPDEGVIPNNSLLREFIGGSVFFDEAGELKTSV